MITYPISMPSEPGISALGFGGESAVAVHGSPFTMAQEVQVWQGQRWLVSVAVSPLANRELAEPWQAFLLALNGREGTFLLGDPNGVTPRGTATGTPISNDMGSPQMNQKNDRVLYTDGWTAGINGILKAGDYIELQTGGYRWLHKLTEDAASDSAGMAALSIWPALRANIPDGVSITTSNARGVFRMVSNRPRWDVRDGQVYSMAFDAAEAL